MKLTASLFLLGLAAVSLSAAENLRLPDIRALAMGENGATQSVFRNPSLLALSTGKVLHFDYFNRYGLKELGTINGSYQQAGPLLPAGIQITTFGYDDYRQTRLRLLAGKHIARQWTLGVSVQYTWWQTLLEEIPPRRLSCDLGATFSPFDNLLIGMLISDFPSLTIGKKETVKEGIKSYAVEMGFQWTVINDLLIAFSMQTSESASVAGQLGIEYRLYEVFSLRAGIQTDPFQPSLGVGYRLASFRLDVATVYHSVLGMSTGVGLTFSF